MHGFFVNLPVEYASGPGSFLDLFLESGIRPEIGLDGTDFSVPETRGRLLELAGRFRDRGLACTVHLPFTRFEAGYAHGPHAAWAAGEMGRALEAARLFEPERLVGHPYLHRVGEGGEREADMEPIAAFWKSAMASWPDHPPLCLENIFEKSPAAHVRLMEMLDDPGIGICFDVGHWHSFSGGWERQDLEEWVRAFGKRIYHLHLHDNDGSADQHLGLGRGTIPWERLFAALRNEGAVPTITLEPHTREDFEASAAFVGEHSGLLP